MWYCQEANTLTKLWSVLAPLSESLLGMIYCKEIHGSETSLTFPPLRRVTFFFHSAFLKSPFHNRCDPQRAEWGTSSTFSLVIHCLANYCGHAQMPLQGPIPTYGDAPSPQQLVDNKETFQVSCFWTVILPTLELKELLKACLRLLQQRDDFFLTSVIIYPDVIFIYTYTRIHI